MKKYNVLSEVNGEILRITADEILQLDLGMYINTTYSKDLRRKYISYKNYLIQVILDEADAHLRWGV